MPYGTAALLLRRESETVHACRTALVRTTSSSPRGSSALFPPRSERRGRRLADSGIAVRSRRLDGRQCVVARECREPADGDPADPRIRIAPQDIPEDGHGRGSFDLPECADRVEPDGSVAVGDGRRQRRRRGFAPDDAEKGSGLRADEGMRVFGEDPGQVGASLRVSLASQRLRDLESGGTVPRAAGRRPRGPVRRLGALGV